MEWKRNKYSLFFVLLLCMNMQAQNDTFYSESEEITENYDPWVHYSEEEKEEFNNRSFNRSFDSLHWKKLVKDKTYDEVVDTPKLKNKKSVKKNTSFDISPVLKYIWLIPVLLILIVLVVRFLPFLATNNIKNREKLLLHLDQLDEEDLKALDTGAALQKALADKNFKLAYRLRYLSVLQQLIDKNLIIYKRDKTNYEYLLQLVGKKPYEPFRMLTFNFDGIWYGDIPIDQALYESLETYFNDFDASMNTV